MSFDLTEIEKKWQKEWEEAELGEADRNSDKNPFFLIFAYPGISGFLHVGHMRGYTYSDVITRYKRMQGHNVLFPVGFHGTGNLTPALAKKIKEGKKTKQFKKAGLSEKEIKELEDVDNLLDFFYDYYVENYWKRFGFLIDKRRTLTTLGDGYKKFIQWQFKKLMQKNLLVQKPYYAGFCPECGPVAVDPSETDLSKGGTAEKQEFTLLKFKHDDHYLTAATLRPETVYGQTNLWVRPDVEYVEAEVDGEKWVVSEECAENLGYQGKDVEVTGRINGEELIGDYCHAPGADKDIIILPSSFPDPKLGTGLVTSVPSDAPYDYIALKELQDDPEKCRKHGLDPEKIQDIEVIKIIKSKELGDFPAKKIVEEMGIQSTEEKEKLEEATQKVYKAGFHGGVMTDECNDYKDMQVSEAKDQVKQELFNKNKADKFYSFSEPVVCRCGEEVKIKKMDDYWFIKYSDLELTTKSKQYAETMDIHPDKYKDKMEDVLDWFKDRPCVRTGSWLGTPFPFDEDLTVEPISDSTLYPAYYIVSLYENQGKIDPEEMTEEFFNYVYLSKGKPKKDVWKQVKKDFEYWYPLDMNLGGKEHQKVHFPAFLMNHVGILPGSKWPKGLFVHWWVLGKKGDKMSKSKGGAEPVPSAVEEYSADGMRLYYCHAASPHQDIHWEPERVKRYKNTLEKIFKQAERLAQKVGSQETAVDEWLKFNFNQKIEEVTGHFDEYELREAVSEAVYAVQNDLNWYERRGGRNQELVTELVGKWCKLITPFVPHLAEEIWHEVLSKNSLVSDEEWPEKFSTSATIKVNKREQVVKELLEDFRNIEELVDFEPEKAVVYTPANWKWKALSQMHGCSNIGECMSEVMSDKDIRKHGKEASKFVKKVFKKLWEYEGEEKVDEYKAVEDAFRFLSDELGYDIELYKETDEDKYDPENKSSEALPLKPAIYLE